MEFIIFAVIYLVINFILATFMQKAAHGKGYTDDAHAFAMVFWFGIIGCLYVIALPDQRLHWQNEKIIELLSNKHNNENSDNAKLPEL